MTDDQIYTAIRTRTPVRWTRYDGTEIRVTLTHAPAEIWLPIDAVDQYGTPVLVEADMISLIRE